MAWNARALLAAIGLVGGGLLTVVHADELPEVLALPKAPPGVVFEIVSGEDQALNWALPEVERQMRRLRARFPQLPIAIVSHGAEQFALTRANRARHRAVHDSVRSLSADPDLEFHVCATHASWRNLDPEDFPDYVNVAAAAPAKINDYRAFGYRVIPVHKPQTH
jgi:intracellular sulfur oxidation DsrE/DsrF family protein